MSQPAHLDGEVFTCSEQGRDSRAMSSVLHSKDKEKDKRNLSMWQVVGVLFVATVGGAYGIEECVHSGGGLATILGVLVIPWVWGLPTAFVVAELATAIPSNAGASMWVNCAFPQWVTLSFILCTGLSNFVDNSLYPNLLVSYLLPGSATTAPMAALVAKAVVVGCATAVNVFSIDLVGNFGLAFTILTTSPFLLLFLLRAPHLELSKLVSHTPPTVDWSRFLPLLSWNISGLDGAGHIVEEIDAPSRNMIKGFAFLLLLTQAVYILPIAAGTTLPVQGEDPTLWEQGHWVSLGEEAGGHLFAVVMMTGGAVSCFGFMTALLCTTSRALRGFATMRVFPERVNEFLLKQHPQYHTPINAIFVNAVVTLVLAEAFDFSVLVDVGQMLYSLRLLFIFASLAIIRKQHPTLRRPFTIPGGNTGLYLCVAMPSVYCVILLISGMFLSVQTTATVAFFVVGSVAVSCATSRCFPSFKLEGSIVHGRRPAELQRMNSFREMRRSNTPGGLGARTSSVCVLSPSASGTSNVEL
eukprot:Rhum_TRINITY_DN23105_c0_g1::Rhum_TRINITY_DN23105_c0_g1_i1::g.177143::m.177143